jgi:release factor glutamine methyltransferase
MKKRLYEIYDGSDFAKENLSFRETVSLILEKYGYSREAFLLDGVPFDERVERDFILAVSGEPLGYILGKVPFYREEYFVGEGVLIPRRDSEILVEVAAKKIPRNSHFLDICTGSGCIGISILKERPDLTATLLDISKASEFFAKKNIEKNGVADRCSFRLFDVLTQVPESASAIVMNPPYITIAEMDSLPENVKKEPSLALFGGEDGLDFYRRIRDISPDATLIFEIGAKQGKALQELFGGGEIIKDYCGFDRVFLLEK